MIDRPSGVSLIAVGDDNTGVTRMRVGGDPVAQRESMSSRIIAIRKAILRIRPAPGGRITIDIDSPDMHSLCFSLRIDDDDRF